VRGSALTVGIVAFGDVVANPELSIQVAPPALDGAVILCKAAAGVTIPILADNIVNLIQSCGRPWLRQQHEARVCATEHRCCQKLHSDKSSGADSSKKTDNHQQPVAAFNHFG
jgi:hypothetical protein